MNDVIKDLQSDFDVALHDIGGTIHGTQTFASEELGLASTKIQEAVDLIAEHFEKHGH